MLQAAGSHLMFILPTYLGTREVAPIRSDFPLLADTADTEPLRLWNRLFCPQCILNIVAGNTVVVSAFRTVNEPSRRCTMQGLCRLGLEFFSNGPENIYLHQTK